eukprot:gb/GEZN01001582.1/.p1 GENE.gb/GEZN01001582.1/~~gb/GEZN01001582.1/.p1  ORF type:complete len:912 (-),score=92.38 gb/GEZN01001582.1/:171-2906(-)
MEGDTETSQTSNSDFSSINSTYSINSRHSGMGVKSGALPLTSNKNVLCPCPEVQEVPKPTPSHRRRGSQTAQEESPDGKYARFETLLGMGAYKKVWLGIQRETGQRVAWNTIELSKLSESQKKKVREETRILSLVKHPYILRFLACWDEPGEIEGDAVKLHFITEKCEDSLAGQLEKMHPLPMDLVKKYTRQVLEAINYLHSQSPPIVHRDIKLENVLLSADGNIKLGDFGLSMQNLEPTSIVGTPGHIAPEVFLEQYTCLADIWSLGVLLLEMVTNQRPYREALEDRKRYLQVAVQGALPPELELVPDPALKAFITSCFQPAKLRPSAQQLLDQTGFPLYPQETPNGNLTGSPNGTGSPSGTKSPLKTSGTKSPLETGLTKSPLEIEVGDKGNNKVGGRSVSVCEANKIQSIDSYTSSSPRSLTPFSTRFPPLDKPQLDIKVQVLPVSAAQASSPNADEVALRISLAIPSLSSSEPGTPVPSTPMAEITWPATSEPARSDLRYQFAKNDHASIANQMVTIILPRDAKGKIFLEKLEHLHPPMDLGQVESQLCRAIQTAVRPAYQTWLVSRRSKELTSLLTRLEIDHKYVAKFEEQEVGIQDLALLSASDLERLVPPIGPRRRLENWLREEKLKPTQRRNEGTGDIGHQLPRGVRTERGLDMQENKNLSPRYVSGNRLASPSQNISQLGIKQNASNGKNFENVAASSFSGTPILSSARLVSIKIDMDDESGKDKGGAVVRPKTAPPQSAATTVRKRAGSKDDDSSKPSAKPPLKTSASASHVPPGYTPVRRHSLPGDIQFPILAGRPNANAKVQRVLYHDDSSLRSSTHSVVSVLPPLSTVSTKPLVKTHVKPSATPPSEALASTDAQPQVTKQTRPDATKQVRKETDARSQTPGKVIRRDHTVRIFTTQR